MKRIMMTLAAIAAMSIAASAARAQEAMYTAAATMPSPGTFWLRTQPHYFRFGSNPISGTDHTERFEVMNTAAYGLARGLAVFIDAPVTHRVDTLADGSEDSQTGLESLDVMFKWRVYKADSGGIDTLRAALMGGVMTSLEGDVHADPMIGGVVTRVKGRHGFNQDLFFRLTTGGEAADNFGGEGPSDAVLCNTAYVYRLAPSAYTSESTGAWYVTSEVNGLYETSGDAELRGALGLMFEGRRWGFEAMIQLPLWDDLDERAELDVGVGVGVRVVF